MKFLDSKGVAVLWNKTKQSFLSLTGGAINGTVEIEGAANYLAVYNDGKSSAITVTPTGIQSLDGSESEVYTTDGGTTTFKTVGGTSILGSGNISFKTVGGRSIIGSGNIPISTGGGTVPLELWTKTSGSSYTNVSDYSGLAGFTGIPFLRPKGLTGDNNGIAFIGENSTDAKEYFTINAYAGGTPGGSPSGSVTYDGPAVVARFESEQFKTDIHAANIPYVGGTYEFPCSYGSITRAVLKLGEQSDCHDINLQLYSGPDKYAPITAAIYAHLHPPLVLTFVSRNVFSSTEDIMCSAFGAGGIAVGKNSGTLGYAVGPQDTYVNIGAEGIDIADPTPNTKIDATWAKNNFDNIFAHGPEVTCLSARVLDIDYKNKIALIRFTLKVSKSSTELIVKTMSSSTVIGGASIDNSKKASIVVSISYDLAGEVEDSGYDLRIY